MDEIYLIGGKFFQFTLKQAGVNIFAFLRSNDSALANKYLRTTGQYLKMYNQLIGPYPYSKFALIENFWETGYGMPSFTLLGPKVIRFPFILHSSYPHELLHNYWGNGVFVDYKKGNWCEGLTVYLADHLIKEQRGAGKEYRRETLRGYTDYVNEKNDFPLTQFSSRTDAASSSIGYGKSMMLFHMLRRRVGDSLFKMALRDFYKINKFSRASFEDIRDSFNKITKKNFSDYFNQWTTRKGAPQIQLSNIKSTERKQGYDLTFTLSQTQTGKPFYLNVPVEIYCRKFPRRITKILLLDRKKKDYLITLPKKPLKIDIDPQFDVFRTLYPDEVPPSLSRAFGAQKILFILPSVEKENLKKAYRKFAAGWMGKGKKKFKIIEDHQIKKLPDDSAVWIIGWNNKFKSLIGSSVQKFNGLIDREFFKVNKQKLSSRNHSIVVCTQNPLNKKNVMILLSVDQMTALEGLARKLPHYGKYSYLAFEGSEPVNTHKGQWEISSSPLTRTWSDTFDPTQFTESLREPLGKISLDFSPRAILNHIYFLADKKLKGREPGTREIDLAAGYIAGQFKKSGLQPAGKNQSFFQDWQQNFKDKRIRYRNVIGMIRGSDHKLRNKPVVVCAHYDHLGIGRNPKHPSFYKKVFHGADDNASGVSALIELANYINRNYQPKRTILFCAFSGEETGLIGSKYFVQNYQSLPLKETIAVINLDTLGRLKKNPPMVIGSSSAREWKFIFMGIEYTTGIKTSLIKENLASSDQRSFIDKGIPGIHLFAGPHLDYHKPTDTPDKIDAAGIVKILTVTREVLVYLMDRDTPLTFTGKGKSPSKTIPSRSRRASIGIMPDFSYKGKGVRAQIVIDNGPAKKAGLAKGDIIIRMGARLVNNLREYSTRLKTFKPGDQVELEIKRGDKIFKIKLTLKNR